MAAKRMTEKQWQDLFDLRLHWTTFCLCDPIPVDDFIERMEAAKYVRLCKVTRDDLDQTFAEELGIVPGGMIWRLTKKGRAALETESR